jgi:hypothetical protein
MKHPKTIKEIEADPRVDCVDVSRERFNRYVMITLADGWVADDKTTTIWAERLTDALRSFKQVKEGQPE